jgi:hypothetical protein
VKIPLTSIFDHLLKHIFSVVFDLPRQRDIHSGPTAKRKKPNKNHDKSVLSAIFCGSFATICHGYPQGAKSP